MERRALGKGGPELSVVGLGCNNFGARMDHVSAAAVVNAALDVGINHFDTAEMYGDGKSEEFLGASLRTRRNDAIIATKFSPRPKEQPYTPGMLALRIRDAVDGSLRRLGTDYIDLYYQHRPDFAAPVDEALEALTELVQAGKVLHIASSNVSAAQINAAKEVSDTKGFPGFTGTQIEWSLLARGAEDSVVPAAVAAAMGVVPFFPLASGLLTGKYRRGEPFPNGTRLAHSDYFARQATDERFDKIEAYEAFAADHDHTVTELAIAWLLAQPSVTSVITGATWPQQVIANAAATRWVLAPTEVVAIAAL